MKIEKFVKKKNGLYEIVLENKEKIEVYQDIILNHNLLLKKSLEKKELEELLDENYFYSGLDISIKYLTKKMRCEEEIRKYLNKKNYSDDIIIKIIKELRNRNLLNDVIFIKSYTNDRFNLNNYGPNRIKSELLSLKIDKELIEQYVFIDSGLLTRKLDKMIDKRINELKSYSGNILKSKVLEYFINKGYDYSLICDILSKKKLDNDGNYEKEYNKFYKKYSKKFNNERELDFFIKQKLYQKGFRK